MKLFRVQARLTSVLTLTAMLMTLVGTAPMAVAQAAYPDRPIRLIVPFPPGGSTDALSRQIAERLSATKGWVIVIENKPGAGGNIGLDTVAKSKPDGYTLGMAQTANLAINPSLYARMPFDARKDFTSIVLVSSQPVLMVVRDASPYRTLADLVAAARARPGTVTMASAGVGTNGHLTGELFAKRAGVRMTHVPYRGFGPALSDLFGGQIDFLLTSPQSGLGQLKAGKLRALGVTAARRLNVLSDVPTVAESGYPGFESSDWKGVVGPAGLPADITQILNTEIETVLHSPELAARFTADGGTTMGGTPKHMEEFVKTEQARWGAAVRSSGATAE